MTFNTGNNVPSTDPRDLYDNAENLDKLVNGVDPFYADRKGVLRQSWAGMENDFDTSQEGRETAFTLSQADKESRFQAFLVSSGYVSKGDYAAGVVLAERNEYVAVSAATTGTSPGLYRPNASATLPLTLTGTWATDKANLVLLGDDVLRQELASPEGADKVGYKSRTQADRNADFASVFDYLTAEQIADVKARTYTLDVTAGVQQALNENGALLFPDGGYLVSSLTIPSTTRVVRGLSKSGAVLRHKSGATGALWQWAGTRVMNARFEGIYLEGSGETTETYGFDLSGFSYCTFIDCRSRLFYLDGWFTDGAITPVNKQNSNNTFISCSGNNNNRDGIRLTGTDPQRYENTANTFIGCEFSGNAGRGVNGEVCESSQWLGCTAQGNSNRDVYFNSRFSVFTGYAEGSAKPIELGAQSYGCKVEIRSGYPLWNTFVDNGTTNECSVMGASQNEQIAFLNPYFAEWVGTLPTGLTLSGAPAVASYADTGSPFEAGLQLTIGSNFQGLVFSLLPSAASLAGQWVTLIAEVETSGVVDALETRVYARDGTTLNAATGQFAVDSLPVTASTRFRLLSFDVKFPGSIAGTPSVIWYVAYGGVSAGGNVVKIRSARIVMGQTRAASMFSGDSQKPARATSAQLGAAAGGINIHRKFAGKMVYDSTAGKTRFATGTLPTSAWRATDGSGDLVPA